jgi:hypothetical protein
MAKYVRGGQLSVKIIKFSRIDFYFFQQYIMGLFDSVGNMISDAINYAKKSAEDFSGTKSPFTGGRKTRSRGRSMMRSRSRKMMKGGYTDNIAVSGLAANAAPFSGETAKPQTMVGGKTRRRNGKGRKTRRH